MNIWLKKYLNTIENACMGGEQVPLYSVEYWQNKLFANTMKAVLPLSLITSVPGMAYTLSQGLYLLSILNVMSFLVIFWIAFGNNMSTKARKFTLIGTTYVSGIYLLIFIGFKGPGFLYLYAACVFALIILPARYAYLWSWLNVVICTGYAFVVHFEWSPLPEVNAMSVIEWGAIAVNLVFISFLSSMLVPGLFDGLRITFLRQRELEGKLRQKHEEQAETLLQLEAKNHEMEQFVYFASHELKEPTRMVNSFLGLFEKRYLENLDEKGRQYIHYAADGGKRMSRIIADLLQYALSESTSVEKSNVDLNKVVEGILKLMEDTLKEKGAKVTYHSLPTLHTDHSLIENILKNLIGNGIKYNRKQQPPEVDISAYHENGQWHIAVKDNGIGINKQNFDRIFELFGRLHSKSEYAGTGIGLAIVKRSVDLLGGKITVESTPGEGSNFIITLK